MKSSLVLTFVLTALFSCTDDLSLATDAQNRNLNTNATSSLTLFPTANYVWTLMPRYNDADGATCGELVPQEHYPCKAIEIGGEIYGFAYTGYDVVQRKLNKSTKQWESFMPTVSSAMKTVFKRTNYLFSYGDKMYTGLWNLSNTELGYDGRVYSVNHISGTIHQLAQFPGIGTYKFISFVVGNRGYVMGGVTPSDEMSSQFWEYNFDTNEWTDKGTMPGGARAGGSAFVIGNDVYVGLGFTSVDGNGNGSSYSRNWIKFDPSNATAVTALQTFPGVRRTGAEGFVLNNKIYLGCGVGRFINGLPETTDDFWEYNPSTNVWKQKAKYPSNVEDRSTRRAAFMQGNAGYVIVGCLSRLWRYSNTTAVSVPPPGTGPVPMPTNP
jgi:hypothetical protein